MPNSPKESDGQRDLGKQWLIEHSRKSEQEDKSAGSRSAFAHQIQDGIQFADESAADPASELAAAEYREQRTNAAKEAWPKILHNMRGHWGRRGLQPNQAHLLLCYILTRGCPLTLGEKVKLPELAGYVGIAEDSIEQALEDVLEILLACIQTWFKDHPDTAAVFSEEPDVEPPTRATSDWALAEFKAFIVDRITNS